MTDDELSPAQAALLDEATQIIDMAQNLQARGKYTESVEFALAARQRLTAIQAIGRMKDAIRAMKEPRS